MKPFNLEEYLANPSRKIVTKDGRKVKRVLCTDAMGPYPIVVLIENYDGTRDDSFQYTKDGCFVARWGCISDASRELKIDGSCIGKCCNGKRKNAGGFIWTFEYRGEKYC